MSNLFINHYGERRQFKKLIEECWELILAIFFYQKILLLEILQIENS